jgi:hypothetical protein
MYELKNFFERYLRANLLRPGHSPYKKRIYRAAVSQRLRNTAYSITSRTFVWFVSNQACVEDNRQAVFVKGTRKCSVTRQLSPLHSAK